MRQVLLPLIAMLSCTSAFAKEDVTLAAVMKDQYFLSLKCDDYLSQTTPEEKERLVNASNVLEKYESMRYISSKDSIMGDVQKQFKNSGLVFNKLLDKMQTALKDFPPYSESYSDETYPAGAQKEAIDTWVNAKKAGSRTQAQKEDIDKYMMCRTATVAAGLGDNAMFGEQYGMYVAERPKKARVGHFEIKADKATYGKTVGTGNKYAEPKQWEGSRFLTVYASFKNLDTESRLPASGSLFINYNGKDYEFDTVEPIMLEGYNIWFRSINPLITMKTKLVYRIPDEIHGEVFWQPGRNAGDVKLYVGSIDAEK